MAYGARLESVLGASPRGFESPILRHRTPGLVGAPGFSLRVRCGSAHGERRPRALRPQPPRRLRLGARGAPSRRAPSPWVRAVLRGRVLRAAPRGGAALRGACTLGSGPPRDGIIRTSPGQECSKDKGALPGARRILVLPPGRSAPPPAPPGRSPRERAPVPRPSGAACGACAFERHGPRPVPWTVPVRGAPVSARPSGAASGFCAAERPRCAQAPRPSTTSAAGSAASSSPGTKSFEARRPDPMQLHPLAQRESMRRRH